MNVKSIIISLYIMILPAILLTVDGQVEGVSEVMTIMMKKPESPAPDIVQVSDTSEVVFVSDIEAHNFALVIGIDNYKDPEIMDLDKPVSDAGLLYVILTTHYLFHPGNVTFLKDPTRAEIIKELDRLSTRLTRQDNLVIFYAGHGYWDEQKESGFWLPSDAELNSSVNWIRNSTIKDFVEDINTQLTLLITDACFGGSIFKTRGGYMGAEMSVRKLYSLPSRIAMTSGTYQEQVPDESVFLKYLLKSLNENESKYLPARELYNRFFEPVSNNSPTTPLYRVIQDTGDEGGDYIFVRR